jgi:hypothetical protein
LPDGFGGLHLKPENIIKWSKINNWDLGNPK